VRAYGRPRPTAAQLRQAASELDDATVDTGSAEPIAAGRHGAPFHRAVVAERDRRLEDLRSWLDLADEHNDYRDDWQPVAWDEEEWDPEVVAAARRAADRYGLPMPPTTGDYDRACQGDYGPRVQRARYAGSEV